MKTRWWLGVAVALAVLPAAVVYRSRTLSGSPAPESGPQRETERWIHGIGYVEPVGEVRRLAFKGNGVLAHCRAEVGTTFRKGEPLVVLRDHEEQAALAAAERELGLARAERDKVLSGVHPLQITAAERKLELLSEQARYLRREQERMRTIFLNRAASDLEQEKACTEMVQAEAARRQAEAELRHLRQHVRPEDRQVAEARVRLAEARVELCRRQLGETRLRAPCDGTVLEVLKREGEAVRPLEADPVLLFADLSRLRVRAEIEERYVHALHLGQSARVSGRGLGGESYPGTVVLVKRIMGPKTVFARSAQERKDLEVLQVLIELGEGFAAPVGLQVDVQVSITQPD